MSKHNNSHEFDFESQKNPERISETFNEAEQFDFELERLLQQNYKSTSRISPAYPDLFSIAQQLHQEAPTPVRPDPAFRIRLANDLRQRALAQAVHNNKFSRNKKPFLSWGWQLGGSVAFATVLLVTVIATFNIVKLTNSTESTTPPNQAVAITAKIVTTTMLASPAFDTGTTLTVTPAVLSSNSTTTTNFAAFGQLPINSDLVESSNTEIKPSNNNPRLVTVNTANTGLNTATPILTSYVTDNKSTGSLFAYPSSPFTLQTPTSRSTNNALLSYTLKTTLPKLTATALVYRQVQPQVSEAKLHKLAQHFGLDVANSRFSYLPDGNGYFIISDNNKTLSVSSNGHLTFSGPRLTYNKTTPMNDADVTNVALMYTSSLGLSINNSRWGTLQKTIFPTALGDNSGMRYINFGTASFKSDDSNDSLPVSEAVGVQIAVNTDGQVTFFDSNLPLIIDDQGNLSFATFEATSYPLITSDQLQEAISKGQINPTINTALKLQQINIPPQSPLKVTITGLEAAYAPTFSKDGRLHMIPVMLVHGSVNSNNDTLNFDGYVFEVQSQYLQTSSNP